MKAEENLIEAAQDEILKILGISVGLLGSQAFFNGIGIGGVYFMIVQYTVVSLFSSFFVTDSSEEKAEDKKPFSAMHSVIRVLVDVSTISVGLLIWLIIGTIQGVEVTFENAKPPEEVVQQMVGDNAPLKILMTFISHCTLYSFTRFWMNFWDLMWGLRKGPEKSEKPEKPDKKK